MVGLTGREEDEGGTGVGDASRRGEDGGTRRAVRDRLIDANVFRCWASRGDRATYMRVVVNTARSATPHTLELTRI